MFFKKPHPKLLPRREFYHRLKRSLIVGVVLILFSLFTGVAGYHWIGELPWIDAFFEAAMILSGMGPMSPLHTDAAKLFAGLYAIYCGITLLGTTAIIFTPAIHRALHRFHLEDDARS